MLLQRSTTGVCHALLRFPDKWSPLVVMRFPAQNDPFCTMWFRQFTKNVTKTDHKEGSHPHSTEHDTQPTTYVISKQAIPYRRHGGTCCPRVSTQDSVCSRFEHEKPHHLTESNHLHHSTLAQTTTLIVTMVKSHLDTHDYMAKHN
jgi:hypothetical protein